MEYDQNQDDVGQGVMQPGQAVDHGTWGTYPANGPYSKKSSDSINSPETACAVITISIASTDSAPMRIVTGDPARSPSADALQIFEYRRRARQQCAKANRLRAEKTPDQAKPHQPEDQVSDVKMPLDRVERHEPAEAPADADRKRQDPVPQPCYRVPDFLLFELVQTSARLTFSRGTRRGSPCRIYPAGRPWTSARPARCRHPLQVR